MKTENTNVLAVFTIIYSRKLSFHHYRNYELNELTVNLQGLTSDLKRITRIELIHDTIQKTVLTSDEFNDVN